MHKYLIHISILLTLSFGIVSCKAMRSFLPEKDQSHRQIQSKKSGQPGIRWTDTSSLELRVSDSSAPAVFSQWNFTFAANNELFIEVDEWHQGINNRGNILLINGKTMLVSGFTPNQNSSVDALDRPVLNYQLLTKILETLYPYGPEDVRGQDNIDYGEDSRVISIGTVSNSRSYAVPWEVTGFVRKEAKNKVRFDLDFRHVTGHRGTEEITINLRGKWSHRLRRKELSPVKPLIDYKVYVFHPSTRTQAGIGIASYEAVIESIIFDNLDQAREFARRQGR